MQLKSPRQMRTSFYFRSAEKQLFGCYHFPQTKQIKKSALVLCNPMGQEYIRCHQFYLQLAVRLSRIGFPVLRFDYYGCGDSAGDSEEGSVAQWIADLNDAIDVVKKRSGLTRICLFGLRLGATLAAMIEAERQDVEAIVLWNPVARGESFINDLKGIQKQMLRYTYVDNDSNTNGKELTEILGFPLPSNMLSDFRKINLFSTTPKSLSNILILENDENPDLRDLIDHYESSGAKIEFIQIQDPKIWLEQPYKGMIPREVIQKVVSWLSEVYA